MFMPGESSVEVQPKILDPFCLRELDIVDVNRGTQTPLRVVNVMCVDLDPLAFILHFEASSILLVTWFVVCLKRWLDHCLWLLLLCRLQRLLM
jgi:hypothetical protein